MSDSQKLAPRTLRRPQARQSKQPAKRNSRTSHSQEDYASLIRISTAHIAAFEFRTAIPCALPSHEFVEQLYGIGSCCVDGSLTCAIASGFNSVDDMLGVSLDGVFPRNRGFEGLFQRWHEQNLTAHTFESEVPLDKAGKHVYQAVMYGRIENETLSRLWIVLRDVTSHATAVRILARTEIHYRALLERTGILFARLSATGTYEYLSPTFADILGLSLHDITLKRRKICDFVHPDDSDLLLSLIKVPRARNASVVPVDGEIRVRVQDGSYHWFSLRQLPVASYSGHMNYVDIIASDITPIKLLEQETTTLREQARLTPRAAQTSHDIRNYLTAGLGQLDVALSMAQSVEPDSLAALRAAKMALTSAFELARDFGATISRPSLTEVLEPSPQCDVATTILDTIQLAASQLPSGVNLTTHLPGSAHIPLSAVKCSNLLLNLILNARDALGDAGGGIRIESSLSPPSAPTQAESITITVADTGCGIQAADIPRIFEPYYTTRGMTGGTGLGLASVMASLEEASGTISVSSSAGVGTTFTITLPTVKRQGSTAPNQAAMTATATLKRNVLTILVGEDEASIRSMLQSALSRQGHTVDTCSDARGVITQLARSQATYDVILIDDSISHGKGFKLLAEVRSRLPHTPVVITSGDHSIGETLPRTDNALHFLPKPFSLGELGDVLQRSIRYSKAAERN